MQQKNSNSYLQQELNARWVLRVSRQVIDSPHVSVHVVSSLCVVEMASDNRHQPAQVLDLLHGRDFIGQSIRTQPQHIADQRVHHLLVQHTSLAKLTNEGEY